MKRSMLDRAFAVVATVVFVAGAQNRRSQRAVEKPGGTRRASRFDETGRETFV